MELDKLISQLSDKGALKPLPSPFIQALIWISGAFIYLLVAGLYFGLRSDISEKSGDPYFVAELLLLLVIATVSALATCCLSRPDSHQKPWIKYVPFALIVPWAITALANATGELSFVNLIHTAGLSRYDCPWHIAVFSLPPAIALFFIVRAGATIRCCWAGGMATLSVTSAAYLMMRLVEQNDNPAHLFVWHALPIMLMCMAGMIIGRLILKWR